ncbi:CoA transferase [Cytobacillus kochii]|uniref:CaiB/BaiF CoA transferase family protein n=1 Tax=Cytobacillus kochii TaxID=859143 RepID=UPI002E1F5480|nr:CoA transferase [Cytobacillus kochii]
MSDKQPLEGVKVLDLSRVFAGPGGSMILADLGADVIRIEAPNGTDSMRDWIPFIEGESTYYFTANRNKKSIELDLKKQKGKEIFLQLVKEADIVLENFKTGTLRKLGLDLEQLKKVKKDIILCSVTGYGQTGPYKGEPGFDPVMQAIGGLMEVTGFPEGEATRVGLPLVDIMTSQYVAIAILAALRQRDQTGEDQSIDLSLLEVQLSALANVASSYLNTGTVSTRVGNDHSYIVPYQVFKCSDRPLMVCCGNDKLFAHFCVVLGREEWISDNRFITNQGRVANREVLTKKIAAIMLTKAADEWFTQLSQLGVPAGPVNNIEQVFRHPQVVAREVVEEIEHVKVGSIQLVKSPLKNSTLNIKTKTGPPVLGQHTEELLHSLGYRNLDIDQLRKEGVIGAAIQKKI